MATRADDAGAVGGGGKGQRAMEEWRLLGRAWRSHEELRELLRVLRRLPDALTDPATLRREGPKLRDFLQNALPAHFQEEEDRAFQQALERAPAARRSGVSRAVSEAQREHVHMAAQSKAILDALDGLPAGPRPVDLEKLESLVSGLCDALARHADKEDRDLIPYVDLPEGC
ncbi:MAG: hemerythrin domain-containing protein [Elusimicrobia bacterium]|nr:hemerythrin domain-containing protein [Elusimicrobiota bacterium]